jgi:D-methionine transport system substrate-binding protein
MKEWEETIMKKILALFMVLTLIGAFFTGCKSSKEEETNSGVTPEVTQKVTEAASPAATQAPSEEEATDFDKEIVIGANATPHAEILEQVRAVLEAEGYTLKIVVYEDYVQPNVALQSGDLDANYFQHLPYLEQFNEENGADLVSAGAIHYEPYGIYPGKAASIDDLKEGSQIAVSNDASNEARALLLLEAQGIIKLKENVGLKATKNDIVENPKKVEIVEIEAAQLARSLQDVDLAVINGNYAIEAGLNVSKDAIAVEDKDSVAAQTYGNIIAVKAGNENREDIKALVAALQSEEIRQYINDTYDGAVIPIF